jgi:hypothetical protein
MQLYLIENQITNILANHLIIHVLVRQTELSSCDFLGCDTMQWCGKIAMFQSTKTKIWIFTVLKTS